MVVFQRARAKIQYKRGKEESSQNNFQMVNKRLNSSK